MQQLAIELDYTNIDLSVVNWLKAAIPGYLTNFNLDTDVWVKNESIIIDNTSITDSTFSDGDLFHFTDQIITNSTIRKYAEANGKWYLHLFITKKHKKGFLGTMYDLGFLNNARQRQGCAVFVQGIRELSGPNNDNFKKIMLRTALHEIGHCLNLLHCAEPEYTIMAQTSFIMRPNWIQNINYNYRSEDINFVVYNSEEAQPGGSYSRFDDILNDTNDTLRNMQLSIYAFTDSRSREFELGGSVSLLIKIRNKSKAQISLPNPVINNGEQHQVWIKAPGEKVRLMRKAILGCGANRETINIGPGNYKHFPLHLFADHNGYMFNKPGKYKVAVAIKDEPEKWFRSRFFSFIIQEPDDQKNNLKHIVNTPEVLKFMVLGETSKKEIKVINEAIQLMPTSAFSRALSWNKIYEMKKKTFSELGTAGIPDKKKLIKVYKSLLKAENSKIRAGKVLKDYQDTLIALDDKSKNPPKNQTETIDAYKAFKKNLISHTKNT